MIVDCHTHINFVPDDDVRASEHLEAAETVDACIVLARGGESSEKVNKKLSEYVGKHTEKMVGFALIEPTKDNISVKHLASLRDKLGLRGFVLLPERFSPDTQQGDAVLRIGAGTWFTCFLS